MSLVAVDVSVCLNESYVIYIRVVYRGSVMKYSKYN